MKGIVSIGLFLCLILPFMATWKFLNIQLHQIKKEVSIKLADGKNTEAEILLKFTATESSQLNWEHSKEFEYKGEMYDVIRSEMKSDSIWYWCHWDKKETRVKKEINHLVASALGQGPQEKNTKDLILNFFKSFYKLTEIKTFNHDITLNLSKANTKYCLPTSSLHLFPPFHPPELS
ncbi:MAG: hypothetical protein ABIQ11_00010 [Saprospiraceae bacterium]